MDVFVSAQASQDSGTVVSVNEELARGYRDAVARIAETLGLESGLNAFSLARFPDVLTVERRELDKDKAAAALSEITAKAVEEFNAMREREGERLRRDMLGKLETIEGLVSVVEERSPQTVKEYRERLEARLRDILADRSLDEQRVITEAAIFADRTAVDEETVRLRSHIAQFRTMLEEGSPIGRKMDFLVQEFNRESNTHSFFVYFCRRFCHRMQWTYMNARFISYSPSKRGNAIKGKVADIDNHRMQPKEWNDEKNNSLSSVPDNGHQSSLRSGY